MFVFTCANYVFIIELNAYNSVYYSKQLAIANALLGVRVCARNTYCFCSFFRCSGLCPKHLLFLFGFLGVQVCARNTYCFCSFFIFLLILLRIDCLQKTHTCKLHMNLKLGMYLEHNK